MHLIEPFTDVNNSFFGMLNQGPLTLTIFLHTVIVLPMFWIYFSEKKKLGNNFHIQREFILSLYNTASFLYN